MHVTLVHIRVKPENVAEFIASPRINHQHAVCEPGNLRFDVLQSPDTPTHFILYEAYFDTAHAGAHKDTEHYARWRAEVADWMAEPRMSTVYKGLFPDGN